METVGLIIAMTMMAIGLIVLLGSCAGLVYVIFFRGSGKPAQSGSAVVVNSQSGAGPA